MIHFKFNMMWILLQLYNDSGLWTMLRAMLGCSSPRVTSTNVHSRWDLHKIQLTRAIKTWCQDGEARPADLETIFFDFEVPSSKYSCRHDFSLEILRGCHSHKINFFTSPNFGNQSIFKSANYFPRLGWRGRCVVIKSVSTQRQKPNIFRFPISSVHKSFLSVWKSFRLQFDYTVVQDLCEMLSYLILPKVEFGTGVIIRILQ